MYSQTTSHEDSNAKKGHSTENVAVCFREIRSNDLQKVSLMFLKDESHISQWSSGWLESLEELLLATHVSTTRLCEVIFWVTWLHPVSRQ